MPIQENRQVCTRCIMDTTAAGITFDAQGQCNYCTELLVEFSRVGTLVHQDYPKEAALQSLVETVKAAGRHKEYDCIVGLSGGVDSSYALYRAKELGLRPLAVHMDNGWDSELAANNIANLVQQLDLDLYTHVINWEEYRGLMQAFFEADVIDIELLYDNAMLAVNYQLARRYGIRYILAGSNSATEGMRMPSNWNWYKLDKKNIVQIAKRFSKVKLSSFPAMSTLDYLYYQRLKKIQWIPFLDYFEYNKQQCMQELVERFGYKPYPYKHYESVFTRFYQGFILPEKFGVDKRKLHLSTLICSQQLTRAQALAMMQNSPYPSAQDLEIDKTYFYKKMGWTPQDLTDYVARPEVSHAIYGSEHLFLPKLHRLYARITGRK